LSVKRDRQCPGVGQGAAYVAARNHLASSVDIFRYDDGVR
jgi:hypothetical protein